MRAAGYSSTGTADVLQITDLPVRDPGPGEVRVRMVYSGVNPTDWKSRNGAIHMPIPPGQIQVAHLDGSGVIDAVGSGVAELEVGQRVWLWLVAYQRLEGTAQEFAVVPAKLAQPLGETASFELGAALGVPFMTAHRALTVHDEAPAQLGPGALSGMTVLVAGGAGAVGNAAIQLARWSGATVITTVSGPSKAELASAAGASHVVNYRTQDVAAEVRAISPTGVDVIVEVSPAVNAELDTEILAPHGVIASYANNGGPQMSIPVSPYMRLNASWHFVLLYTMRPKHLDDALAAIDHALADGALGTGHGHGLPIHIFELSRIADAHRAVEDQITGKVLVSLEE